MGNLRDYAVLTASYWMFTVTDGALRMLILLHLYERGYSPLEIASMFLFYELFGIVTNLVGGWLGARFGLRTTLFCGLGLQSIACGMLTVPPYLLSLFYVMAVQALSGIAKDLTKMSSKSYVKLVVPKGDHFGLMKWVSLLTGSKNTLKGIGFFLGGLLLTTVGFRAACFGMAVALAVALFFSITFLPRATDKTSRKVPFTSIFTRDPRVNWLSLARLFLFGARDIWFVLALPIFFASELGWSHSRIGSFLALWIICYGIVQASAPAMVNKGSRAADHPVTAGELGRWTAGLLLPLAGILISFSADLPPGPTLILGLALFGIVFAMNSAIHSYLIVAYAEKDKVALRVGFYYMANATGRLLGTFFSGAIFQTAGMGRAGLLACIVGSAMLIFLSWLSCFPLKRS